MIEGTPKAGSTSSRGSTEASSAVVLMMAANTPTFSISAPTDPPSERRC